MSEGTQETTPAGGGDRAEGTHGFAVLTSGGDAPGMNAAVRAVVRTALHHGVPVHAVHEGFQGLVAGGDYIRPLGTRDVGGILHRGGTIIGSARSEEFRTLAGRRRAAQHLVERGIDRLVVIGGDGSLTGAKIFRDEWSDHLAALVEEGRLTATETERHATLSVVGLVGSIDNDLSGTDMTIGADTALHRITEAMDALHSTAASHQRSFVVEVMGRNCGYLALMSALAAGANWTIIPEQPPDARTWAAEMCDALRAGRQQGRRQNMVVVAEGAHDTSGEAITADRVKHELESRLGEDTRITILGHVQRGGAPSAFDRNLATICAFEAVELLLRAEPGDEPQVVGMRENRVVSNPLIASVEQTHAVIETIATGDYDQAMRLRGGSFTEAWRTFRTLVRATPHAAVGPRRLRVAVLHAGEPAPGMNTAVRTATRIATDRGHEVLGVRHGFEGLASGDVEPLAWMDVSGWTSHGGAELGTSLIRLGEDQLEAIAIQVAAHRIDGLLVIGGWAGCAGAYHLSASGLPALDIPVMCLPATIDSNIPGSELSIGADTALNSVVTDVDKLKQSAVATQRCYIVETMGGDSGYLALMSGMASGAERVYLPEEGITLDALVEDVDALRRAFVSGKRLGLIIRNEHADEVYTTDFIRSLFLRESEGHFDVRASILGDVQQGGVPSPFDRIQATRLATRCVERLIDHADEGAAGSALIGLIGGQVRFTPLTELPGLAAAGAERPAEQFWQHLRPIARVMAQPEELSGAPGRTPSHRLAHPDGAARAVTRR